MPPDSPDHSDAESSTIEIQAEQSPSLPPTPGSTGHNHPPPSGLSPPTHDSSLLSCKPSCGKCSCSWWVPGPGRRHSTWQCRSLAPTLDLGGMRPRDVCFNKALGALRSDHRAEVSSRSPGHNSFLPVWEMPEAPEDHNHLNLPSVCSSSPHHSPPRSSSTAVATDPDLGH